MQPLGVPVVPIDVKESSRACGSCDKCGYRTRRVEDVGQVTWLRYRKSVGNLLIDGLPYFVVDVDGIEGLETRQI